MKALVICAIRGEVLCLCAGMHCTLILVSAPALNRLDKDGGGKKTRGSGGQRRLFRWWNARVGDISGKGVKTEGGVLGLDNGARLAIITHRLIFSDPSQWLSLGTFSVSTLCCRPYISPRRTPLLSAFLLSYPKVGPFTSPPSTVVLYPQIPAYFIRIPCLTDAPFSDVRTSSSRCFPAP